MTDIDIEVVARKINKIIELTGIELTPLCLHVGGREYPQYGGGSIRCTECNEIVDWEETYDD